MVAGRRVRWLSGGASAIATKLDIVADAGNFPRGSVVAHCETGVQRLRQQALSGIR